MNKQKRLDYVKSEIFRKMARIEDIEKELFHKLFPDFNSVIVENMEKNSLLFLNASNGVLSKMIDRLNKGEK